jgi:hypothetical protein
LAPLVDAVPSPFNNKVLYGEYGSGVIIDIENVLVLDRFAVSVATIANEYVFAEETEPDNKPFAASVRFAGREDPTATEYVILDRSVATRVFE